MQPLSHGCWRIEIVPSPDAPADAPPVRGRLPRIVRQGAEGTANTAPPLTTGLVGIFSQMTTEHWLLVIQHAPPPDQHVPGTMLLTAGDKLLFERVDGDVTASGSYASNISTPTHPSRSAACEQATNPRHHPILPKTVGGDPHYQASPNTKTRRGKAAAERAPLTKPLTATTPQSASQ